MASTPAAAVVKVPVVTIERDIGKTWGDTLEHSNLDYRWALRVE
jgi:hypothetical protein